MLYKDVAEGAKIKEFPKPYLLRESLPDETTTEDGHESDSSVPFDNATFSDEDLFESG